MEQLLLVVTSCDLPEGIGASLQTHAQRTTHTRTEGPTDVTLEIVF